ncbi:MAG TPA: ThuA domain-containing protein [Pirellulales bacterium]|jgi:hypothetical protein|nr:ThuA domain-containing protein [Pirellulales bacterium]
MLLRSRFAIACGAWLALSWGLTSFAAEAKPDQVEKMEKALPESAPAKPKEPRKILVYTHASGFVHSSIALGAKTFEKLGEKTGAWKVTKVSDDPAVFDDLKDYDAIVLESTTGDFLVVQGNDKGKESKEKEPARRQALLDFVHNGKGLVGIHAATDAYYDWPAYGELIGGAFKEHPYHNIVIKVDDPKSPINAQFNGEEFKFSDEIYVFRPVPYSRAHDHVLLSVDVEKSKIEKQAREDKDYAVAWIREAGKGRVFYTLLGHSEETYWNPIFLKFVLAGTQYALGDLKADASTSGK